MRSRFILALALGASCFFAIPAQAKVGDPSWSACAWEKAPVSANNWIAMPPPVWSTDTQAPSAALALRLVAVCATEAANELRPNRDFNWKQMAAALRRAKTATPSASDVNALVVKMCRNYLTKDGGTELFRIDVVREDAGERFLVFQQHFVSFEGKAIKLPQDLRSVPDADDGKLSVDCKIISSDGSLIDA